MLAIILLNILNSVLAINYCTLCKNETHTMCQFKEGPSDSCINYTKLSLTPAEKMYILDIHNDIRNHVASGQESRGALGNQPPAADMFLLEWDEELEAIAQRWADQCISANAIVQHDKCRRTENFEVGQNVVTAISPDVQLPEVSVLILSWYKQITSIVPSDVDEFTGIWRGKHQIGQYTQLVWAKTRHVGCAAAAFKETVGDAQYNIRFVCNYGPAGNVVGQSVYQRGKPCSKCPYRACDEMRPNLCGGIHKNVNIRKPNTIFQKYKDKATTLSNLIDIEDPKINTRFLNFSILNIPKIIESHTNVANTTQFVNFISVEMEKDLVTNISNVTLANTTVQDVNFTDTYLTNTSIFTTQEENYSDFTYSSTLNNEDYLNISDSPQTLANRTYMIPIKLINSNNSNSTTSVDNKTNNYLNKSTLFDTLTDVSTYRDLNNVSNPVVNTTLSTQWSEDYKRNLKFRLTFGATIELIMGSFFNKSTIPEITKQSVTDLTKNRCERIKLNNGIILVQDCEDDSRDLVNPMKKFSSDLHARKKIFVEGNDVILPGNRRFKKVSGIWHNGHCRCVQPLRSCSNALDVIQYLFLLVSFIYFVII